MKICLLLLLILALLTSCGWKHPIKITFPSKWNQIQSESFAKRKEPKRIGQKPGLLTALKSYNHLSAQFNLVVFISELNDCFITSHITISVLDKQDSLHQKITMSCEGAYPLIPGSLVRSYETKVNLKKSVPDEFFGEIIVGDFNFDGLSDIAVVNFIPMSGTPMYAFYLQKENLEFVRDPYLSDVVKNLPQKLNPEKKSFMAYYHTGCCAQTYRYFKFEETGKCKLTYTKEIDLNQS